MELHLGFCISHSNQLPCENFLWDMNPPPINVLRAGVEELLSDSFHNHRIIKDFPSKGIMKSAKKE